MNRDKVSILIEYAYKVYQSLGFRKLTEIQERALSPLLLTELDTLLVAPTGSGKTEAAMIPLLTRIIHSPHLHNGIKLLYITPLRALNRDILERINKISSKIGLTVDVWHGDTPQGRRKRIQTNPPDILITTPESLQYILVNNKIQKHLTSIRAIVIDEAQELVESERGAELVCALERLDYRLRKHIRRVALSAAVGSASTIANYVFSGRPHLIIEASMKRIYDIKVLSHDISKDVSKPSELLLAIPIVLSALKDALKKHSQILLFVNTRVAAEALALHLSKAIQEGRLNTNHIAVHHASLSRPVREDIEKSFRQGSLNLVIATSSLEMGIDIGGIDLVLQLQSPRQAIRLAQRIGRAGHRKDSISRGIVIVPPLVTEIFEALTIARRAVSGDYEPIIENIKPLDVLAHQILGIALEYGTATIETILRILGRTIPFKNLTREELMELVKFLLDLGLIRCDGEQLEATTRGKIHYLTTTPIVESKHYIARSVVDGKTLGALDEEFVATCNEGDVLVLGGNLWRVITLDLDHDEILLEPVITHTEVKIPRWIGETIPVEWRVARETCALIRRFCNLAEDKAKELLKQYFADESLIEYLLRTRKELCTIYPRDNEFVLEVYRDREHTTIAFYHCRGTKASEVLAILLIKIFRDYGVQVYAYRPHQLATIIITDRNLDINKLKNVVAILTKLSYNDILNIVNSEIKNTPLFKWRLLAVAKKMGIVSKNTSLRELRRYAEALYNMNIVVKEAIRELLNERLDIDATFTFLNALRARRILTKIYVTKRPSRYLVEIASLTPFASLKPATVQNVIYEAIKRRLTERVVTLFCLSCSNTWHTTLSSLLKQHHSPSNYATNTYKIYCPRCRSQAITLVNDDEIPVLKSALTKARSGIQDPARYTEDEKRILKRARAISNLVMDYGVLALVALQGRGIGPETAKRLLARSRTLDDLIKAVYEQEKLFLRTSRFWH